MKDEVVFDAGGDIVSTPEERAIEEALRAKGIDRRVKVCLSGSESEGRTIFSAFAPGWMVQVSATELKGAIGEAVASWLRHQESKRVNEAACAASIPA